MIYIKPTIHYYHKEHEILFCEGTPQGAYGRTGDMTCREKLRGFCGYQWIGNFSRILRLFVAKNGLGNLARLVAVIASCFLGCASALAATATDMGKILDNMGNVGLNGLPKLSYEIVDRADVGELASLGFGFKLTHNAVLRHGRTARTEWSLPCPRTSAYVDAQGTVTWLTTTGQTVRFQKDENGYSSGVNSATVNVMPESNIIEITTRASVKWRYRNGFLESISNRRGNYSVTTEHGTILSISKVVLSREVPLLKCTYSKQGDLEELEFAEGRKYRLQWSSVHDLLAVDGPEGRRFDFEYVNSLLSCWTQAGGSRNELKWQYHLENVRTTAFQTPPVLLREDASYVYDWNKGDSVDILKIYDKAGNLLSETKIGSRGVEQTTPNGKITHSFRRNP